MADRDDIAPPRDEAMDATLDRFVDALDARLRGSRRQRAAVLAEIRDHLDEAVARYVASGLPAPAAADAAVAGFGSVATVAEAFVGEQVIARVRHTVAALLLTGPLVGVWWLFLFGPRPLQPDPGAMWRAIPALPLVLAAIVTGLGLLATTGRLMRWVPESSPQRALTALNMIAFGCIAADLVMMATLLVGVTTTSNTFPPVLSAVAVTASTVRIGFSLYVLGKPERPGGPCASNKGPVAVS